jgi:DNA-binding SARP family transcriptional activator/tetratricopeptide (TPR) repeat protein
MVICNQTGRHEMTLRLTTFGSCRLEDEAVIPVRAPTLSLVMLAYLYDVGRSVSRHDLGQFFWPDAHEASATNLRSMLRRFTTALPEDHRLLLDVGNRHVALNRLALQCDLELSEATDLAKRLTILSDAVTKRFLPALGDGRSPLDKWVRGVRAHVAADLRATFFALKDSTSDRDNRSGLKRAAILLLEEDPYDEEVRQALLAGAEFVPDTHSGKTFARAEPVAKETTTIASMANATESLPRVALLPPETPSDAQKGGSIANGLIEDLTIGLCTSRSVSVVAPYTAEKIRASNDKASLLQHHNVIYALDTKRTEDFLFAQLIFMPTDEVIWATRFRLDPSSATAHRLVISEAIHQAIVGRMQANVTPTDAFRANPEAYFAYLRGLQHLSSLTLPNLRRARAHFKEALTHQKGFSVALAGISKTLSMEWVLTARGDDELLAQAERLAGLAITEDGNCAGAFKELGVSQLYRRKIDESLFALGEAEKLSPHYADVLCSHADSLTHGSNPKAALEKVSSAISLNPLSPDTYFWTAAGANYFLQDYREALNQIERMRDPAPASRLAAACWGMLGETKKARAYKNRALSDNPDFNLERWLAMIPHKEAWQTELYREGLMKAGF